MTIAPKYTPAYQVYLIFLLESVLGTAWVWIVINEVPPLNTIIGGLSLLFSVLIYMILETRK
jgi:drug/metabolite transporter (DMT)-like permease